MLFTLLAYNEERPELGISAYALRGLGGKALTAIDISKNPFLSPGSLDVPLTIQTNGSNEKKTKGTFEGYPPSYISYGGREILCDEIVLLGKRMQDQALQNTLPTSTLSLGNGSAANGIIDHHNHPASKAKKGAYSWVTMDEEPEMWHDFAASPFARKEALRVLDGVAAWLAALPPGSDYPV